MQKEQAIFLPKAVSAYKDQTQAFMMSGMFGLRQGKPVTSHDILLSLSRFGYNVNSGRVTSTVSHFGKPDRDFIPGEYFLSSPFTGNMSPQFLRFLDAKFWVDGQYGFALGYKGDYTKRPLWLAVASFSIGANLDKYRIVLTEYKNLDAPVLVQLQGAAKNYTYKNTFEQYQAKDLLSRFRWEFALVSLFAQWAAGTGYEEIYLLPAERSRYKMISKSIHLRHDVTARRIGFDMHDNGLYVFPTTKLNNS